jgi:hypothetical protein
MRKMTVIALALTGAVALGCGAGSNGGNSGSDSGGSNGGDKPAKTAKIGDPARDGKFEFTVQKIKCGVSKVGPDVLAEKAQGQFCLITIKVKNIGKEAQIFSDSAQKGFAADGTEYSTDSGAGLAANENADAFLNEINPGNQVTGVLVFDIPKNVKLAKLELHDSPFSGGVTVQLK